MKISEREAMSYAIQIVGMCGPHSGSGPITVTEYVLEIKRMILEGGPTILPRGHVGPSKTAVGA